ncbi:hypothetical protein AVEN_115329-1 [Araneus ventricosus]|uniref:SWIM-type domain-containing protein n=1 Tax=Araneus ventricosus TaxID=182803 RepID=A0A4Y1ZY25_ARAVE|nr:hypothetical protein AVEN_115329-1 [Araneus ventricosus]
MLKRKTRKTKQKNKNQSTESDNYGIDEGDSPLFNLIKKIPGSENTDVAVVEEWINSDEQLEFTDAAIVEMINVPVVQDDSEEENPTDSTWLMSHREGLAALESAMRYVEQQPEAPANNMLLRRWRDISARKSSNVSKQKTIDNFLKIQLGEEVSPDLKIINLRNLIVTSTNYELEFVKLLNTVVLQRTEESKQRKRELESEERRKREESELELEKNESFNAILQAQCTCAVGAVPAYCKHVFTLLHAISDYSKQKLYAAPTAKLQTWHQPKAVKTVPLPCQEVFGKPTFNI